MGTGWEPVTRGTQSGTPLHTVSPFTTPSRDGVLSLSVGGLGHPHSPRHPGPTTTHQSQTRATGGIGSGP